jgi:isopenicillin N synthase-like dioxygenase
MRVGPHSDFGMLSILDRQVGVGGWEAWSPHRGWFAPPYVPGSLAVILGDLTGWFRWRLRRAADAAWQ